MSKVPHSRTKQWARRGSLKLELQGGESAILFRTDGTAYAVIAEVAEGVPAESALWPKLIEYLTRDPRAEQLRDELAEQFLAAWTANAGHA